jgi:hypothetical protein
MFSNGGTNMIDSVRKTEIISDLQSLQPEDVQSLSDGDFLERMLLGMRVFSKLLQPFAVDFFRRFKESKTNRKEFASLDVKLHPFLAYTNLDRAAVNLTGYSVRQLRNIAKGEPTPKKPAKQLPPEEKEFRRQKAALEAKVAANKAAANRTNILSSLESEVAVTAVQAVQASQAHQASQCPEAS